MRSPTDGRDPWTRRKARDGEVEATRGRIGGHKFGDRARDAHTASTRDEPAPDGRGSTTSIQRVREGRHYSREQSTDTDGEGECRQVAEFSLEDWLVSELRGKLCISITHIIDVDMFSVDL